MASSGMSALGWCSVDDLSPLSASASAGTLGPGAASTLVLAFALAFAMALRVGGLNILLFVDALISEIVSATIVHLLLHRVIVTLGGLGQLRKLEVGPPL